MVKKCIVVTLPVAGTVHGARGVKMASTGQRHVTDQCQHEVTSNRHGCQVSLTTVVNKSRCQQRSTLAVMTLS